MIDDLCVESDNHVLVLTRLTKLSHAIEMLAELVPEDLVHSGVVDSVVFPAPPPSDSDTELLAWCNQLDL